MSDTALDRRAEELNREDQCQERGHVPALTEVLRNVTDGRSGTVTALICIVCGTPLYKGPRMSWSLCRLCGIPAWQTDADFCLEHEAQWRDDVEAMELAGE
jgi:hypothetical protein